MRKVLLLFVGITLTATLAQAQFVTEESYTVYQEPYVARSYGNANWSYVTAPQAYPQPVYQNNAYAQAQYGQDYAAYQNYQEEFGSSPAFSDASPVFSKKAAQKRFYLTTRVGMGKTTGFDDKNVKGKMKDPSSAILSLSLGGYLTSNIRVDAEFAYHTKGKLYEEKGLYADGKLEYDQYDFGLNGYYDFWAGSKLRPFVGVGIWGSSARVHAKAVNTYRDTYDDRNTEIQFAVSGAVGAAYHFTDTFALEVMGRARYIFDEDIYNLEGLLGTRFSF